MTRRTRDGDRDEDDRGGRLRLRLRLKRLGKLRAFLPELNFITIHYTYFIITCFVTSLIFWGTSDTSGGKERIGYTDALFMVVSGEFVSLFYCLRLCGYGKRQEE